MPIAKPAITRPAMSMGMVAAPACSAQLNTVMLDAMKSVHLRPMLSFKKETITQPSIAPPGLS